MKPSTRHVLNQLRQGPQTTHDLVMAGCGSRFGARICELRNDFGYVIEEARLPLPTRGSRYTLVSEPGAEQASGGSVMPRRPSAVLEPPAAQASALATSPSGDGGSTPPAPAEPSGLFEASAYRARRGYEDAV